MEWITLSGMMLAFIIPMIVIVKLVVAPIKEQVYNHIPTQISNLHTEMKDGMNTMRTEVKTEIIEVKTDVKELRGIIIKYIAKKEQ